MECNSSIIQQGDKLAKFKNKKNNSRQNYIRNKRLYFNAAQDYSQVQTISEELVRKRLVEDREDFEEHEEDNNVSKQLSSTGHISTKHLLKRTYKGNNSLNLESGGRLYLKKPISLKRILTVWRQFQSIDCSYTPSSTKNSI